MRIHVKFFFYLCLVVAFSQVCYAENREFGPGDGLDRIGKFLSKAAPGDRAVLRSGTYKGSLKISRAEGDMDNPVILEGMPGAVIDARNPSRTDRDGFGAHGIQVEKSSHLLIKGLEIRGAERGVTIGGAWHIRIEDCRIHDVRNYGIMNYKSSGTRIVGNVISRSVKEHGIYLSRQGRNIIIEDNLIEDTHINGIHCNGKISELVIQKNRLDRIGTYPDPEGGAAITMINGASNALIRNNIFHRIHGQGLTIGGSGVRVVNNVFHDVAWSIVLGIKGGSGIYFFNNIVWEKRAVPFQIPADILSLFQSDYNYYTLGKQSICAADGKRLNWKAWQGRAQDLHSIEGRPPFDGSDNGVPSYRLQKGSKAVDGGLLELEDLRSPPGMGSRRSDMGAYGGPGNDWNLSITKIR